MIRATITTPEPEVTLTLSRYEAERLRCLCAHHAVDYNWAAPMRTFCAEIASIIARIPEKT